MRLGLRKPQCHSYPALMPFLAILLLGLLALPAQALESEVVRSPRASVSLVTDRAAITPGEQFPAGLPECPVDCRLQRTTGESAGQGSHRPARATQWGLHPRIGFIEPDSQMPAVSPGRSGWHGDRMTVFLVEKLTGRDHAKS